MPSITDATTLANARPTLPPSLPSESSIQRYETVASTVTPWARTKLESVKNGFRLDSVYLLHCSMLWHQHGDTSAGWELVHALRVGDRSTRAVAAALFAKAENARLPARRILRSRPRPATTPLVNVTIPAPSDSEVNCMKTPYGLEIIENCMTCKLRKAAWLCGLSSDTLHNFSSIARPSIYPDGALLFVEGQQPRGAFVLCSGRVKLSTTSREGKVLILKVAGAGEVLGLSAVISGTAYELTAETNGPCQVSFVEKDAFIRMIGKSGELGLRSAQAVSQEFQTIYRDIHDLVLARSSAGKLARLLLSWTRSREIDHGASEIRIRSSLTHEEMAQMIGASRETVTRLLSDLKKKELIRLEGSVLVIRNRMALEAMAV